MSAVDVSAPSVLGGLGGPAMSMSASSGLVYRGKENQQYRTLSNQENAKNSSAAPTIALYGTSRSPSSTKPKS